MLAKYAALYETMAGTFQMSAAEVRTMRPWDVASMLGIRPNRAERRRARREPDPKEEQASLEEKQRAREALTGLFNTMDDQ